MALVKCPGCGQEVSDSADACGYCGAAIKHAPVPKIKPPPKDDGLLGFVKSSEPKQVSTKPETTLKEVRLLVIGIGLFVLLLGLSLAFYVKLTQPSAAGSADAPAPDGTGVKAETPVKSQGAGVSTAAKPSITPGGPGPQTTKAPPASQPPATGATKAEGTLAVVPPAARKAEEAAKREAEARARAWEAAARNIEAKEAEIRQVKTRQAHAQSKVRIAEFKVKSWRSKVKRAETGLARAKARLAKAQANPRNYSQAWLAETGKRVKRHEAALAQLRTKLNDAEGKARGAKTEVDWAKTKIEALQAQAAAIEVRLAELEEKEFTGNIVRVINPKLLLLEQKRGGRPKQWRDGKAVAWSAVTYFNIALEMDTRSFAPAQVLKVAAVAAGFYKDGSDPAGIRKMKKYKVTAIR